METLVHQTNTTQLADLVVQLHSQKKEIEGRFKAAAAQLLDYMASNELKSVETQSAKLTQVQSTVLRAIGNVEGKFLKSVLDTEKVRAFVKLEGSLPENIMEAPNAPFVKVTKK